MATQVVTLAGELGSSSKRIRAGQVSGNKQLISKVLGHCADGIRKIRQLNFCGGKTQTTSLRHGSILLTKQKVGDFIHL